MTNDELLRPKPVIPSEVEAVTQRTKSARPGFPSQGESSTAIRRDPSTPLPSAQDDCDFVIRASSFIRHSSFVIRHCRNV